MKKYLDLKTPCVMELGKENLKDVEGGFITGLLVSLSIDIAKQRANASGGMTEEEYSFWYEGVSGLPYEGWEAGY